VERGLRTFFPRGATLRRGELIMEQPDNMLKTALDEIERLLTTKTVIGEPIKIGDNTIVPLIAVGFGFGGGGGTGEDPKHAGTKGAGSGAGGAAGIRPIALIVVDKDGKVRVESVRTSTSIVDKVGDAVVRAVEVAQKAKVTTPA
jgi:uncharacterized spore protein YtfJ